MYLIVKQLKKEAKQCSVTCGIFYVTLVNIEKQRSDLIDLVLRIVIVQNFQEFSAQDNNY